MVLFLRIFMGDLGVPLVQETPFITGFKLNCKRCRRRPATVRPRQERPLSLRRLYLSVSDTEDEAMGPWERRKVSLTIIDVSIYQSNLY